MADTLHDGLYEVLRHDEGEVAVRLAGASHPLFEAHFPGNPILPGFMQLDIIARVLNRHIDAISSAKFMKVIVPEMTVVFEVAETKKGYRVVVRDDSGAAMSDFRLRWS